MKIQMPVPGTSYAELRKKNPPKRTERKALNIKQRDTGGDRPADADDQVRPSLKVVPSTASEPSQPVEASPDAEPHSEASGETQAQVSEQEAAAPNTGERQEGKDRRDAGSPGADPVSDARDTPQKAASKVIDEKDRIGVRGSIAVPARGAFALFDTAVQHYGEPAAVKALLDAALKTSGGKPVNDDTAKYPNTGKKIRAFRTVPASVYEEYRKSIDPLAIMPSFKIGSLYLQGMLTQFYKEPKNRNSG